jgi:sugar lactone lactonase YvrE
MRYDGSTSTSTWVISDPGANPNSIILNGDETKLFVGGSTVSKIYF